MNEIRRFHPSHLWACQGLKIHPKYLELLSKADKRSDLVVMSIFSMTHELIGVAGVKRIHNHCGEPFAVFVRDPSRHKILISKSIKRLVQFAHKELKYSRLQTYSALSHKKEIEFMKRMGFVPEGIMQGYDPDTNEDCLMLGRVQWPQQ